MIIPDSSVWIDYFNGQVTPQTAFLKTLLHVESLQASLLVGDLILCEVLKGRRTEDANHVMEKTLCNLSLVTLCNPQRAVLAARHFRSLAAAGITVRNTIDVIIATFCMEEKHVLLHKDRDFDFMREPLGLLVASVSLQVKEEQGRYDVAA